MNFDASCFVDKQEFTSFKEEVELFIENLADKEKGASLVGYTLGDVKNTLDYILLDSSSTVVVNPGDSIQEAIDFLYDISGGTVLLSPGIHNLDNQGTIYLKDGVSLKGHGGLSTKLYRSKSYGDTIVQRGGLSKISGLFLSHGHYDYQKDLDFRLSDNSCHLRLINTINFNVEDCIFWRMPYSIVSDGAIRTTIQNTWCRGVWDKYNLNSQEGIADILFCGNSQHGQMAKIDNCYFSGSAGSKIQSTYSDGSNSVVSEITSNTGCKTSIYAESIEDLQITNSFFGRSPYQLIKLNPRGQNGIILDVRIANCFFDDCGDGEQGSQIFITSNQEDKYILGVNINGCTFNGEYNTNNAVVVMNNSINNKPTVVGCSFTGNSLFAHTATPLVFLGANSTTVSGNTITNWNCKQAALLQSTNMFYKPPVYVGPNSRSVLVTGNSMGGGADSTQDLMNYCYEQVCIDQNSLGSFSSDNLYSGIRNSLGISRGYAVKEVQYIDTSEQNYQLSSNISVYIRKRPRSASSTVALPILPVKGHEVVIKDGVGNVSSSYIIQVISPNYKIDGSDYFIINQPFGFAQFRFNGLEWNRIA